MIKIDGKEYTSLESAKDAISTGSDIYITDESMKILSAPNAASIYLWNCQYLELIDAPKAKQIEAHFCDFLTDVIARDATIRTFDCRKYSGSYRG